MSHLVLCPTRSQVLWRNGGQICRHHQLQVCSADQPHGLYPQTPNMFDVPQLWAAICTRSISPLPCLDLPVVYDVALLRKDRALGRKYPLQLKSPNISFTRVNCHL